MKLISVFLISTTIFYCVSDRGNTHYDNLKCEGEIPSMFVDGLDDYVKLQDEIYKDYFDNDKDLDKLKEKLILGSALNHSFYFRSGLILFGDPVTNYLNKMKDVLLKEHDLKDKISIYTLRSSEVNAFCALDGNVYFTLGLISRANSEAELAFVLSHEISHYLLKHSLEQLKSEKEIDQMRKDRNKLSLDDMLKFKLKRKRSHEFEADSLGFAIFNKSPYFNKGAIGVLNFLSTSHVPLGEKPFDPEFFSADFFKIPACFFKDEVLEVEARESIEDEYLTHPDIKKRKEKINHFIDNKVKGVEFVNNKKEFDNIKKLATYEMVHRLLVARKYGDAIYTAFNLLQQYPDDEFLNLCLAKGLYGASVYKNNQKYHFVASRYTSKQGESQQIHYLLKHLTARQLNTLTLKYIYSLKKKYPQSHFLGLLENSLVEELVLKHNLTLDDFYSIKDAENQYVLYFDKPSDEANSKIKQRQEYKNFYLLAFAKEREDKALQQKFLMAKEKLEEKEAYKALSYKEKMKLYKDSEKVKKK
ncbi:MAG: M48 family metallopeptidase, partial [Cytophagaceae bacterium]